MKEIVITVRRQKIEVLVYFLCLIIAIGLNVYSILKYNNTSWMELLTQLPYVLVISLAIYAASVLLRLLIHLIAMPFRKKSVTPEES